MRLPRTAWLGLQWRVVLLTAAAGVALPLAAAACGGSGAVPASRSPRAPTDSAAAGGNATAAAAAAVAAAPTLVVGGRYETLPGAIVCPSAAALRRLSDVARQGDTAAFVKALDADRCAPVVTGAVVRVAEQQQALARVRRAGDTSTYWMSADKLSPR